MKFQIDLNKYPSLRRLFQDEQEKFAQTITNMLVHINNAVETGRFEIAKEVYKTDYIKMMEDVIDVFYELEGIVQHHKNKSEQQGLRGLDYNLHPLAIFTNNATVYDAAGNIITPHEYMQLDQFNIKDWLYALFYGARFVSWKELTEYLTLSEYELIDVLKARNFEQLARIQPALTYQEQQGIPKGKLIAGTGLFDGGQISKDLTECPACGNELINNKGFKYITCTSCKLGGEINE